jgi:hypothetical protein
MARLILNYCVCSTSFKARIERPVIESFSNKKLVAQEKVGGGTAASGRPQPPERFNSAHAVHPSGNEG